MKETKAIPVYKASDKLTMSIVKPSAYFDFANFFLHLKIYKTTFFLDHIQFITKPVCFQTWI